jgi:hypothetical protein
MARDVEAWRHVLPFPLIAREGGELMLGQDASGLDFRASILVEGDRVTLSTAVRTNRLSGRLYFALIRRFHPLITRTMLRRAYRRVALAAPPAGERHKSAAGAGPA